MLIFTPVKKVYKQKYHKNTVNFIAFILHIFCQINAPINKIQYLASMPNMHLHVTRDVLFHLLQSLVTGSHTSCIKSAVAKVPLNSGHIYKSTYGHLTVGNMSVNHKLCDLEQLPKIEQRIATLFHNNNNIIQQQQLTNNQSYFTKVTIFKDIK